MGILQQFVWMGWSAFGGPAAHIGLFQKVNMAGVWLQADAVATSIVLCWQHVSGGTSPYRMARPSHTPAYAMYQVLKKGYGHL